MIRHNRGNRRDTTEAKVKRKKRIVHDLNDYWVYKYDGQYRKGKIHCSCPMCSSKTNAGINKSKGKVDGSLRNLCRLAVTNERYGKKNWKASDKRKIDRCRGSLKGLYNESEVD